MCFARLKKRNLNVATMSHPVPVQHKIPFTTRHRHVEASGLLEAPDFQLVLLLWGVGEISTMSHANVWSPDHNKCWRMLRNKSNISWSCKFRRI
jgi:hypothetical protein